MKDQDMFWHFMCWKQFNKKVFKQTLTQQDIKSKRIYFEKIYLVKNKEDVEETLVNDVFVKMEKDGTMYLLADEDIPRLPINPLVTTPCYLKESDRTIFHHVTQPQSAKMSPEKTMTFQEYIDGFNPIEHSYERTRIFLNMVMIASRHKPVKIQLCSAPSSGKTMCYNILQYITNDVKRISKPTLAKLETLLYYYKVILPDEMSSLSSAEVREVEPLFLTLADESPELEKHSIASNVALNKINLEETSVIFTYNRREDLKGDENFFTEIWQNKGAFQSRYPALLLGGQVTSTLPKLNVKQAEEIMQNNYDMMRRWAKNTLYFIKHLEKEMHYYQRRPIGLQYGRQAPNFEGIIDCVDAYCNSQAEFDEWMEWISERISTYKQMDETKKLEVKLPKNLEKYKPKE